MATPLRTPSASVIWLLLLTLTLTSYGLFEGRFLAALSTFAIVAIAAFKARLVVLHFMEARHAPGHWRFVYETWVFEAAAIIAIGHYVAFARFE